MVIWNMVRKNPAPSMLAASWMSCGIELSPPKLMTVASGSVRQTWTPIIEAIARDGCPSQTGQAVIPGSGPQRWSQW